MCVVLASHTIASNSGHWIPLDQTEAVISVIRRIFETVSATAS